MGCSKSGLLPYAVSGQKPSLRGVHLYSVASNVKPLPRLWPLALLPLWQLEVHPTKRPP
jgi:hypothetical protein